MCGRPVGRNYRQLGPFGRKEAAGGDINAATINGHRSAAMRPRLPAWVPSLLVAALLAKLRLDGR